MSIFGEEKLTKEKFNAAKKSIKILDVNVDNIVVSKLIETKSNCKYLIGYLDKPIKPISFDNASNEWIC